ncbi:hypothetical protein N7495_001433 [Penicillium taxi]|uniref:uncharacterized protein n=1 Tax=Penicillium taxi TaxID=168475 RepID=UPI0025452BDF|nr:uncharacterized protein N7495_001433 [Penicillium taxi]KAJ5908751.1 hypothetical protein N7495_001433 [Penicillium taxi]
MMLDMAITVLRVRYKDVAGFETAALSKVAGYDQFADYLVFEESFINWDKTLESIDEAVGFDLTQKLANEYKASIINFAQNIESRLEAEEFKTSDIMHLNVARAMSTTITQLKEFADSDSDSFSRSTCSSDDNVEFGYSDSD